MISNFNNQFVFSVILLGLPLAIIGCGHSGPEISPVSGRITIDGQPLSKAAVGFIPSNGGPASSGVTDENGNYQLLCAGKPGAVVGENSVTIIKLHQEMIVFPNGIRDVKKTWLIPKRYGMPDTSKLSFTVMSGGNEGVDFDVSSK